MWITEDTIPKLLSRMAGNAISEGSKFQNIYGGALGPYRLHIASYFFPNASFSKLYWEP
jgi:hypothetical protein